MRKNLIVIVALALLAVPQVLAGDSDSDRGYLGVTLSMKQMIHDGHVMEKSSGLVVGQVLPGGAAELAGLEKGDKIVAVDGRDVDDMDSLHEAMGSRRKGDRISVTVLRDGSEQTFGLELAAMPSKKRLHVERFGARVDHGKDRAFMGIESQPVGSQLADYFGVEGGILVTKVIDGTAAAAAGIEAGDVIVAWGDSPISKVHDLHEALAAAKPGDEVALSISRRGAESRTFVTLGSAADYKKHHHEMHGAHEGELHIDTDHDHHVDVKVIEVEKKRGGE